MTKPVIIKRATKGSALTYTELDTNFQNLDDATISVVAGGTTVVNDLNGTLNLVAGTGITLSGNNTTKSVTITASESQNLFQTVNAGGTALVADSTTDTLTLTAGTGISITGNATTDTATFALANTAVTAGSYTAANITVDAQGRITSAANGSASNFASPPAIGNTTPNTGAFTTLTANTYTGQIYVNNATLTTSSYWIGLFDQSGPNASAAPWASSNVGYNASTNTLYVNGSGGSISATGTISAYALSGPLNGTVGQTTPAAGSFTTLAASTSITGALLGYRETVQTLGTTSGVLTLSSGLGNVKTLTLNGNLTLNSFSNPVAGQSITLIITHSTANNVLSSTMKFGTGTKTLSTTIGAIDVIHIFYDGTNYLASLVKGYA